jgi:hypothetical protein
MMLYEIENYAKYCADSCQCRAVFLLVASNVKGSLVTSCLWAERIKRHEEAYFSRISSTRTMNSSFSPPILLFLWKRFGMIVMKIDLFHW